MISGYCTCPVGTNCAPCKHKSAVAKHFKEAHFTVTPINDPCQRAMYHYIAWGRTLEPSYYRNVGDCNSDPKVKEYITEKLTSTSSSMNLHESVMEDDSAIEQYTFDEDKTYGEEMEEGHNSDTEQEYNSELVRTRFAEAMDSYRNAALGHQEQNPQDPGINKAMMAMTRTLLRSANCTPLTRQNQMHNFGKGTVASNRTKHGGTIPVGAPTPSRRTFKVPGRGPAPLGRPVKDRSGRVQLSVTDNEDLFAMPEKPLKETTKKKHNITDNVSKNQTNPKRQTKQ